MNILQAPRPIIRIIEQGYSLPFLSLPSSRILSNQKSALDNAVFVSQALADMLVDGSIREVASPPTVCSPLLVVQGRSGKKRLVINLRYINRFLLKVKFKYEDIRTGLMFFEKGDFLCTFDLKSGYHHVDIHVDSQQFLGCQWEGKFYVFTVLPFGLSTACYVFTKLVRPLVAFWRSKSIRVVVYIDDGIIVAQNFEKALWCSKVVQESLEAAGFVTSPDKCHWDPQHTGQWLGFNLDLGKGKISIPQEKIQSLKDQLIAAREKDTLKEKSVASIVGRIISMGLGIGPIAQLRTRSIYALLESRCSWYDDLRINVEVRDELEFWICCIEPYNGQDIGRSPSAMRVV